MTETIEIKFLPDNKKALIKKGSTLFDAAKTLDLSLRAECGGKGTCCKCRVFVDRPEYLSDATEIEKKQMDSFELNLSHRLACQAEVRGPVVVTIAEPLVDDNPGDCKARITGQFQVNSGRPGSKQNGAGIAFDIGTTTIAAYLCHMGSGKILAARASHNPQRLYGEDVISRIAAIQKNPSCLKKLQAIVVETLNALTRQCCNAAGIRKESIQCASVVGNTTMEYILSGLNPKEIGVSPYLPKMRSAINSRAGYLGLILNSDTPIYIFPVISGFLGGDILSALLADPWYHTEKTRLIIDIGTNGELILSTPDGIWATSCATGPAFEGAQISCGTRAVPGAVNVVTYNPRTDKISFQTIDNEPVVGICGSGIIDTVAALRKAGIILASGAFNPEKSAMIDHEKRTGKRYLLGGDNLYITLKDIRQVQLAKAALCVGIESLLHRAGIKAVDHTLLTGAFGASFTWQHAVDIGMLPGRSVHGEVTCIQNMAGSGAVMALLDPEKRVLIEKIAPKIKVVDLASEPDFTTRFSQATSFPDI